MTWISWIFKTLFYSLITGILSLGALLYTYQRKIIYPSYLPPDARTQVAKPSDYDLADYEEVSLRTRDNVRITGYMIYHRHASDGNVSPYTLLYLHANAGNMGHRIPIAHRLYRKVACNIFMLSYRGYGKSDGEPSETGLKIDAQEALDFIKSHPQLNQTKIIVYGQSIGGAVAIHLASNNVKEISGLILENTFTNLPNLIPQVNPYLKYFVFLCSDKWESDKDIQNIKNVPVLFLSGSKDELIRPLHMKTLHSLIKDQCQTEFASFENGTHNDTCLQPMYFEEIFGFFQKYIYHSE